MPAAGRVAPNRRIFGAAIGHATSVVEMMLRCKQCGVIQVEPVEEDASIRAVCTATTCLFCGRLGSMTWVLKG